MREIEFRGKRKDTGEWVYGNGFFIDNAMASSYIYDNKWFAHCEVIPETVGQYTGLEDRNDVKIFEGDILKVSIGGHVRYAPYFVEIPEIFTELDRDNSYYQWEFDEIEVIGNIHDNPELLGASNGSE